MQLGTPGSTNVNLLLSDRFTFRNADKVVADNGGFYRGKDVPPNVGEYSIAQLLNPAGSGVTLLIDQVVFATSASILVALTNTTASLDNLVGAGKSFLSGGAAGQGTVRYQNSVAAVAIGSQFIRVITNTPYTHDPPMPYILVEGQSLLIRPTAQNQSLDVNYYWREV